MAQNQNVFVWNNYQQWRKTVLLLLADLVDKNVLDELRKNQPRCFAADNLEWLDRAIKKVKGIAYSDICATLIDRFSNHYQFIRAFHGCRPESVESYKEHGLLPSDPALLNKLAFQLFPQKEKAVEAVIKDLEKCHECYEGKVYFCLQLEELVEDCGHYLLYGSEHLGAIGIRIGEPQVLRQRGRATAIECNVPTVDISAAFKKCLIGQILKTIAVKYCLRLRTPKYIDFGFFISRKLEPENIINFHFPTGIPNTNNYRIRED
jgi:hypothetical protein